MFYYVLLFIINKNLFLFYHKKVTKNAPALWDAPAAVEEDELRRNEKKS